MRPSSTKLLEMPQIKLRQQGIEAPNVYNKALLSTIKVPKNLGLLSERLPAANYDDLPVEPHVAPLRNYSEPPGRQAMFLPPVRESLESNVSAVSAKSRNISRNDRDHLA
eukprot:CAMPEP_0201283152 /NCGR_PEP_ID=MMETSP1317-20130820/7783_1 /ASSEMBLY_ACC=CAM_ASM_000770 /TAXON_ID=187299 /ORGANISM="Undescribed Undescribed, Strain Undescribed" /LENGTH=109 /DNA_ID=CAMNT_0047598433 /DNA_START=495 /DNA_END=824 /DNA_ORIENTATION=-